MKHKTTNEAKTKLAQRMANIKLRLRVNMRCLTFKSRATADSGRNREAELTVPTADGSGDSVRPCVSPQNNHMEIPGLQGISGNIALAYLRRTPSALNLE